MSFDAVTFREFKGVFPGDCHMMYERIFLSFGDKKNLETRDEREFVSFLYVTSKDDKKSSFALLVAISVQEIEMSKV